MSLRARLGLLSGVFVLFFLVGGAGEAWATTCSFNCAFTLSGVLTTIPAIRLSLPDIPTSDACVAACASTCGALPPAAGYDHGRCMSGSSQFAATVLGGECSPPVAEKACLDVESSQRRARHCESRKCADQPDTVMCCDTADKFSREAAGAAGAAGTAATTDAAGAASSDAPASGGVSGRLSLPPCATTHDWQTAGMCTLDDIKAVGVSFANFLMGLAAAFFLAIFVWAGFKYIFFAYDAGVAGEARKTLVGAAVGMLLVLGAASIVRFVVTAATGRAPTNSSSSSSAAPAAVLNGACVGPLTGKVCLEVPEAQRSARGCVDNHCMGLGPTVVCCNPPTPPVTPAH